jgi:hypothetical protein
VWRAISHCTVMAALFSINVHKGFVCLDRDLESRNPRLTPEVRRVFK